MPTQAPQNPVSDPATATAVSHQTTQGVIEHNQAVAALDQQIAIARATVTKDTQRLTSWNPPVDKRATSILGCFQLAASRLQGQSAAKLVYVASDLENNTDVDYTQSFVTQQALKAVTVHVIFLFSQNAQRDQQKRHDWCAYLKSAGASAVLFSDLEGSTDIEIHRTCLLTMRPRSRNRVRDSWL